MKLDKAMRVFNVFDYTFYELPRIARIGDTTTPPRRFCLAITHDNMGEIQSVVNCFLDLVSLYVTSYSERRAPNKCKTVKIEFEELTNTPF